MKFRLRLLFILTITLFILGCTGSMVVVSRVDGTQFIDRALTKEQVREAIMEGAERAGWSTKDIGNDKILAVYSIRVHTISVEILYYESSYSVNYSSSTGMKMFCTSKDRDKTRDLKVSGHETCPYGWNPHYIHGNYKKWVDELNVAIQREIAAK